jgi:hypothetical protein
MKVAILTCILGNFDTPVDPVPQDLPEGVEEIAFHRFTDEDFPPITGLTPRLQYRIPKLFGYEMFPGYDIYIWLDGSVTLKRPDCVKWYLEQLGDADFAFFKHPTRRNIRQESEHIEEKLQQDHWYITPRYKNGLHKEMVNVALSDSDFKDNVLYTSTAFVYRASLEAIKALQLWWLYQSRYYTCDQIAQPFAMFKADAKVNVINENQYKIGYLSLVSHHK